jgi:hypothetical protein
MIPTPLANKLLARVDEAALAMFLDLLVEAKCQ